MIMKKYIAFVFILFSSCDDHIDTDEVITIESSVTTLFADGTSKAEIIAYIPEKALPDKRKIKFEATSGNFVNGENGVITVEAQDNTLKDGKLAAKVTFIAPPTIGTSTIKASIEGYDTSINITLIKSEPSSILLSASAFSVFVNFAGEVKLIGLVTNASGNMVSKGIKIKLEDFYQDGTNVGGKYRECSLSTNSKGEISAYYSPGPIPSNIYLYIVATVLDNDGAPTDINDTIILYTLTP